MGLVLLLLPAIIFSAIVGFLGRRRVIGFWGFFAVTLAAIVLERMTIGSLLSPFVIALFLFISSPGKRYQLEAEMRIAETLRRSGIRPTAQPALTAATVAPRRRGSGFADIRVGFAPLIASWLGIIVLFALVYWMAGTPDRTARFGEVTESSTTAAVPASEGQQTAGTPAPGAGRRLERLSIGEAFRLSFDGATLGGGGVLVQRNAWLPLLLAIERLATLVVLVLLVSSLVAARASVRHEGEANRSVTTIDKGETGPGDSGHSGRVVTTTSVVESRAS